MNLADYISKEKYIDKKHIIFLRHAPKRIKKLIKNDGKIKEPDYVSCSVTLDLAIRAA